MAGPREEATDWPGQPKRTLWAVLLWGAVSAGRGENSDFYYEKGTGARQEEMAAEGWVRAAGERSRPAWGRPRSEVRGGQGPSSKTRASVQPPTSGPRSRKGWLCSFGLMVPRRPKKCAGGGPGSRSAHPLHCPAGGESPSPAGKLPSVCRVVTLWPCWLLLSVCPLGYLPCARLARLPLPCCPRLSPACSPHSGPLQEGASDVLGPVWGPPVGVCGLAGPRPPYSDQVSGQEELALELRGAALRPARWTPLAEPTASGTQWSRLGAPPASLQSPERERAGLWAGGALGSIPSQLSHDAPVIRALLLGTPTPRSCRDQPAAPPPAGPGRSMCPGSGGLSHGGDGGWGARNLKRKHQPPENLENVSE